MSEYVRIWVRTEFLSLILRLEPLGENIPFRRSAKLFSMTTVNLHALLNGKKPISRKLSIQLTRLENISNLIFKHAETPGNWFSGWLMNKNKAFEYQRPIDMMNTVRGYKQLLRMIEEIDSGAFF